MTDAGTSSHVFAQIYRKGHWKGQTPSGPGSTLAATALVRAGLLEVFDKLNIRSLCDAPCGDGNWIFEVTKDLDYYFGVDIVPELIFANLAKDLPLNHLFQVGDIIKQSLPKADAVLCRDCIVHLTLEAGLNAIQMIKKSGSRYLIATTFPKHAENVDMTMGKWRRLNMRAAPFNLPKPLVMIAERSRNANDPNNDKSLGVWDLASI